MKWEEEQNKLSTILDELKIQMSTLTSVQIENLSTTSRTSIIAHGKSSLHDNEVIPNETAMLYNRENVHIGSSDSMGCTEILHRPIFSGAGDDQVLNDVKLKLNTGNVQYNERSNVEDNSGPNSSNFTLENLTDQRIELSPLKPPGNFLGKSFQTPEHELSENSAGYMPLINFIPSDLVTQTVWSPGLMLPCRQ